MDTAANSQTFVFEGFCLDATHHRLSGPDGAPVQLTPRAFDLLHFMVQHPGELLDKRTLMKAVWPARRHG